MDRFAAMRAFVRVVEAGSFTKAAATLDLPNASVTRLIQSLEQDLQARLLHRTTRSVTVTAEGAAYYDRVVRLLADLADIESSTRMSQGKPSGKVRVETAAAIAGMVIVPALHEFYRDYPDIDIELGVGNRVLDVVAEGIDCAIRIGNVSEQMMVARRIGSFTLGTYASPAFLKAHGRPGTPQDLLNFPMVGMMARGGSRPVSVSFSASGEELEIAPRYRLLVNDTNSLLAAGVAGLGIIRTPCYAAREALASGKLVPVLEEWGAPTTIPVSVVYAPNRYLSGKVRVFIDWVITVFERNEGLQRA